MATTSIWSIKGWLGKVVIYVENPEKTKNPEVAKLPQISGMEESDTQSLSDVIAYAVSEEKTRREKKSGRDNQERTAEIDDEQENVMEQYVSGVNCTPTTARSEMMAVKKRYGKDEGIMAFHGYQSFAPGECTPAMAHEIGVKLAEELWGSRFQVLVATHLDKAHHLHNHFVVNSVSFADGKRYHRTNQDYRDCAVRDPKGSSDGMVDIMVKEEDAPRINRIVERFKFASVTEAAQIKTEIQKSREEKGKSVPAEKSQEEKSSAEKSQSKPQSDKEPAGKSPAGQKSGQSEPEIARPEKSKEDKLMDELMGEPVKKEGKQQNPSLAKTEKSHPSEPISGKQNRTAGGTSKPYVTTVPEKPSVRKELNEIKAARKKEAESAKRNEPARDTKSKNTKPVQHKQPQVKKKPRKVKER